MGKLITKILGQFRLILMGLLMLVQPALGGDLPEQAGTGFKGKIFGDQLILIDIAGRQSTPKDGIYTIQDGTKIKVKGGKIADMPVSKGKGMYSTFIIIEVDYYETE